MRYVLAFFLPPLAVLMCKRPGHFFVNLILWLASIPLIFFLGAGLLLWLVCTVHALAVCRMSSVDRRVDRIVSAIEGQRAAAPAGQP